MSPRLRRYDTIIDAAEVVVAEVGAAHMTLDAVAVKAGISKGGLLYHFPTKEALLEAMIKKLVQVREAFRKETWRNLPDSPTRELKAHILSDLLYERKADHLGPPILAALAHNPKLAEPVRKINKERYVQLVSENTPFERVAVLALAADGLLFQEVLSISPFTEKQRKMIVEELLRIADEGEWQGKCK